MTVRVRFRFLAPTFMFAGVAFLGCGGSGPGIGDPGSGGTTVGSGGAPGDGGVASGGALGTGGELGTGGLGGGRAQAASFEPLKTAATWTYGTTERAAGGAGGTVTGSKIVNVEVSETVPTRSGVTAWRIHTVIPGVEDQLTWQAETSTAILRYRDEVHTSGSASAASLQSTSMYTPSKFRIDTSAARLVTGAKYTEAFEETDTDKTGTMSSAKTYGWEVVNGAEKVTVPAGTFTALHLQKTNANSGAVDKDYWFVRGVGKVKETSAAGRTEVLMSYDIP